MFSLDLPKLSEVRKAGDRPNSIKGLAIWSSYFQINFETFLRQLDDSSPQEGLSTFLPNRL